MIKRCLLAIISMMLLLSCEHQQSSPTSPGITNTATNWSNTAPLPQPKPAPELADYWTDRCLEYLSVHGSREEIAALLLSPNNTSTSRDSEDDWWNGYHLTQLWRGTFMAIQDPSPLIPNEQGVFNQEFVEFANLVLSGRFCDPNIDIWELLFNPPNNRTIDPFDAATAQLDIVFDAITNNLTAKGQIPRSLVMYVVRNHLETDGTMLYEPCDDPACQAAQSRIRTVGTALQVINGAVCGGGAALFSETLVGSAAFAALGAFCSNQISEWEQIALNNLQHACEQGAEGLDLSGASMSVGSTWGDYGGPGLCDPMFGCDQ